MAETAFHILKISIIVFIASVFMVAINALLSLVSSILFGNFISEFFALISMYLPFDANAVFVAIGGATTAVFSFLLAKKVFDLTSWSVSAI